MCFYMNKIFLCNLEVKFSFWLMRVDPNLLQWERQACQGDVQSSANDKYSTQIFYR